MRKISILFLLIFIWACALSFGFAQSAEQGSSQPPSGTPKDLPPSDLPPKGTPTDLPDAENSTVDPVLATVRNAFEANSILVSKHKDVKKYFDEFVLIWRQLFEDLRKAQDASTGLEDQFSRYHDVLEKADPLLKKLKPPADFKDFNDTCQKGVESLSDWVENMKGRIHYAATDYQRKAYMEKLADFQKNWYTEFFGSAVDALNAEWGMYSTYFWRDNLDPKEKLAINKDQSVGRYLGAYHHIRYQYLKAAFSLAQKAREAEESDDDPNALIDSLKKEVSNVEKTRGKLQKLAPPPVLKDFQALELQRLELMEKGVRKFVEIETAMQNHLSDEKVQGLINEKNQIDQKSKEMQIGSDQAYKTSLKTIAQ